MVIATVSGMLLPRCIIKADKRRIELIVVLDREHKFQGRA
jgi:hypothetical protein